MANETAVKSFWDKPEGKTGMVFGMVVLVLGGFAFIKYLPTLLLLAQNTLYLAGMLAVGGAILYVALDPSFRNLVFFMYKAMMKRITSMFIEIDPIAIIEVYIGEIKGNRTKMDEQLGFLKGHIQSLTRVINDNQREMENKLGMAQQARERSNESQVGLQVRMAEKLKESNFKLAEQKTKLEMMYKILSKMYENTGYLLEDITFEVDVQKRERKAITAGYNVMRSAMKIINGDRDQKDMFDEAMEFMAADIGMKVGEMERFMETSASFMDSIDLQNGAMETKGLDLLAQWEQDANSLFNAKPKSITAGETQYINVTPITKREGEYSELFK